MTVLGAVGFHCFYSIPRGLRGPGPCAYFCRAAKVGKNAPEPMVLDSLDGGHLAVPYPLLRGFTDCGGDEEFRCHVNFRSFFCRSGTCRSPADALSKGYCLQGALVLTEHSSAPSLPDPRAECREATSTFGRTVRRSKHRHRPDARTTDRESEGRSVIKHPRNEGGFSRNVVP